MSTPNEPKGVIYMMPTVLVRSFLVRWKWYKEGNNFATLLKYQVKPFLSPVDRFYRHPIQLVEITTKSATFAACFSSEQIKKEMTRKQYSFGHCLLNLIVA